MDLQQRIASFATLGLHLRQITGANEPASERSVELDEALNKLEKLIPDLRRWNAWFTEDNVRFMLADIAKSLTQKEIETWVAPYGPLEVGKGERRTVAIIMAGNIPAVGFHDFLSVLISGHNVLAKLSSNDDKLIPALADILCVIEPEFKSQIAFTSERLSHFDAVIATGSNNSSRYFDYYFGKYPHIIRKNRNAVALLVGAETEADFEHLADDIFQYYGLGCRNVSKLYLPSGFNIPRLLDVLSTRTEVNNHTKYFNNYEYNKAIYLVNGRKHFDAGNLLLVEDEQIASPVSVLYYEFYDNIATLTKKLQAQEDGIQCIVSHLKGLLQTVPFGNSQHPALDDYADGVDSIAFLKGLA